MAGEHHVVFRFELAPSLALYPAPALAAAASDRATRIEVDSGLVTITCVDRLESYGRRRVLGAATAFLRGFGAGAPSAVMEGELSAPSCRDRPEHYAITLNSRVSIARTDPHRAAVTAG